MARIPRDIVDAVRDRTDIVAVISRHVTLRKSGNSLTGLCPFHQEKTPSFNVIPSKSMYYCFGCQEGGDVFKFIMKIDGLSFVDCVKELAGPAGVVIPERDLTPDEKRALRARSTLFDVLEEAASVFESTLWTHPDGQVGRDYLRDRELSTTIAREARVGFAPEGWTRLIDHLHRKGFPAERAIEAGLAIKKAEGGRVYDTFRSRLMFPIRDERGRIVGFGGRYVGSEDKKSPKYINTPETRLYDKSRVLYGLHTARNAIQQKDRVIVVEGYFDVLAMQQAGFFEAVATCGTSLTPEHLERIRRMTRNVLLLMDGDNAGQKAAARSLPMLLETGLHAFKVELVGAKDPDEFVQKFGAEAMSNALDQRRSLLEWYVDRKVNEYSDKTARGTMTSTMANARVLDDLRPILSKLPQPLLANLAQRLRMGVNGERQIYELARTGHRAAAPKAKKTDGWKPIREIVHILWLLVHRYDQVADLLQRVSPEFFVGNTPAQPAIARLLTGEPVAAVAEAESDPGVHRTLLAVVARTVLYTPDQAVPGICDMLETLATQRLSNRKRQIQSEIEEAIRLSDSVRMSALFIEKRDLATVDACLATARHDEDFAAFIEEMNRALDSLPAPPPPPPEPEPEPEPAGAELQAPPPELPEPDPGWVDDRAPPMDADEIALLSSEDDVPPEEPQ